MATPLYGRLIGPMHIKTLSLAVLVAAAFVHPAQAASGWASPPEAPARASGAAVVARAETTLSAAWGKALAANPGLQAARHGAEASSGAVLQSQARPNPELAYSQEDTRSSSRSSTVQLNQLVELGGKREARIQVAERERDVANSAVLEAKVALRFQLVSQFNELLLAQQRVDYAAKTHALAQQSADAAARRVEAGKVPPLEASRAQVAQANALLELNQARSNVLVAQQNLAALWGGQAAEVGMATGDFSAVAEPPNFDDIDALLNSAPGIATARLALEQSRAASNLERSKRVQDLTVSLGVKRAKEVGRNQIVFGVSIPLPLFDSNEGNQLQALRKVDQAEQHLQDVRLQIQTQVFAARQQLLSSNSQVQLLRSQVVPTAQSAYELAVRGFSLGKFSFLDALDAQRTLFDSQRQLLEQLSVSHKARAEIDRLLGSPTVDLAVTGI